MQHVLNQVAPPAKAKLPRTVRSINFIGRILERVGMAWPALDAETLCRYAIRKTDLRDFGDPGFRQGLEALMSALNDEARLNQMGRLLASVKVAKLLINRLKVVEFTKRNPDIRRQRIVKPIFILGLPRTGTTILHNLLSQDPASRSPLSWETAHPVPPRSGPDNRIETARREIANARVLLPDFQAIHPLGAELPQECLEIMALNFVSPDFNIKFHVPSYGRWCRENDLVPTYLFHKQFLQLLNFCRPGERWLLKSPAHLGSLKTLLAVYPDARIIHTHRDPTKVLPSMSSLVVSMRGLVTDHVDPVIFSSHSLDGLAQLLDNVIETRQSFSQSRGQFYDLQFVSLMNDPFAAIKDIYRHFDMELTPHTESAMRRFLAENHREKHGKHEYTAEMYGMKEEQIVAAFARYCEYFGVQRSRL